MFRWYRSLRFFSRGDGGKWFEITLCQSASAPSICLSEGGLVNLGMLCEMFLILRIADPSHPFVCTIFQSGNNFIVFERQFFRLPECIFHSFALASFTFALPVECRVERTRPVNSPRCAQYGPADHQVQEHRDDSANIEGCVLLSRLGHGAIVVAGGAFSSVSIGFPTKLT